MMLKKFRQKWLVKKSEEKKTHPEHKYSVTFVSKVGTINLNLLQSQTKILFGDCFQIDPENLAC